MITKCMSKLAYLACLFIALAAPPNLNAQTYHLSDGQPLVYGATGPRLAYASGDNYSALYSLSPSLLPSGATATSVVYNQDGCPIYGGLSSIAEGEAGGAGGVVNLMTSGYNAVTTIASDFQGDGWMAVLPLTPAQASSNSLVYTQNYIFNTITQREWASTYTPPIISRGFLQRAGFYSGFFYEPANWMPSVGIEYPNVQQTTTHKDYFYGNLFTAPPVPIMNVAGNQTTFATWFHSGGAGSPPGSPWTSIITGQALTASVIWSNGQLHLTDNSQDIIVAVPAGWNGDVAIINMAHQGVNSSDGWNDAVYYMTATVGTPQPPSGTISVSTSQVQAQGKVNVSWQLQ